MEWLKANGGTCSFRTFQPMAIIIKEFTALEFILRFTFQQRQFLIVIVVPVGLIWIFGLGQDEVEI